MPRMAVSPQPHADSIADTLRAHIAQKAHQARQHGASPFFLAYVRPPGRGGSDVSGYPMATALRDLNRKVAVADGNLWLSLLLLDWTPFPQRPDVVGLLRPTAQWPAPLGPAAFGRALRVDAWPLQV